MLSLSFFASFYFPFLLPPAPLSAFVLLSLSEGSETDNPVSELCSLLFLLSFGPFRLSQRTTTRSRPCGIPNLPDTKTTTPSPADRSRPLLTRSDLGLSVWHAVAIVRGRWRWCRRSASVPVACATKARSSHRACCGMWRRIRGAYMLIRGGFYVV